MSSLIWDIRSVGCSLNAWMVKFSGFCCGFPMDNFIVLYVVSTYYFSEVI